MSSQIQILPESLVNKISAGEVIERPASVVKELLENSLDAGAKKIIIELEAGGKRLIRVIDDGIGMSEDDALLSLERHATSKIKTEKDLFAIQTLGFRGEALPSISAVSRLILRTREQGSELGVKIRAEAGVIKEVKKEAMPVGTSIEASNLFFNVPARKKFLKSTETELGHILETATRIALAYPEVGFELYHNHRLLFRTFPQKEIYPRVFELLGEKIAGNLIPVSRKYPELFSQGGLEISGLISPVELHFSTTRHLYFYINRRYVRDKILTHSLLESYRSRIPKNRYPAVILFLKMPASCLDVNVHPTKLEVRFNEPGKIYQAIKETIEEGLSSRLWQMGVPKEKPLQKEVEKALGEYFSRRKEPAPAPSQLSFSGSSLKRPAQLQNLPANSSQPAQAGEKFSFLDLRVLGQFHSNYILLEGSEELIILDQHAVHERINFEKLKSQWQGQGISRQNLLFPQVVELNHQQYQVLEENFELIKNLGFELEQFGGTSILVKAIPASLKEPNLTLLISDLVDELSELGKAQSLEDKTEAMLKVIACHSSVRAGQILNEAEIKSLLQEMEEIGYVASCPHGRPAIWRIGLPELEKKFSR